MQLMSAVQNSKKTQTCLIVEDSEFDQEMMKRIIKRSHRDLNVQVVSSLRSARIALKRDDVSLILLDNNLPDGVGANFALELAAHEALRTIPVIMVSDWPSPFMWEKAATAGVLYVVNKSEFGSRYVHAGLKEHLQRVIKLN